MTYETAPSGSATLPNVRTPYLRLRLPIAVRRVQRGKAELAMDLAKLGGFFAPDPADLDRLGSPPE
jgi:hypothetical protein